jgi:hypothetical protein
MMKSLVCLLAVSAFSFSAFAAETTKFNFSGDAYVRGYFKNSTGDQGTQAFAQFFRLNIDAKPDDNLVVKTGLVLAGESWEGDNHKSVATGGTAIGGTNDDGTGNGDVTHLDHAQIEYTKNNWITSVGRMAVTSPGSFLTSDDRRDRIQVVKIFENYHALALVYDKRAEGALNNSKDDLDMYSANYYGAYEGYKFAVQTGYWQMKGTTTGLSNLSNLDGIKQVTPQFEGTLGGVSFNLYYTLLFGGSVLFKDEHHSLALKLSKDFEVFKVEAQSMLTRDGGLIAGGYDSLSSVINNSPDHNQSLIQLRRIGFGLGAKNVDENFSAVRFSKQINEDFSASLGGGLGKMHATTIPSASVEENNTVVDATARYNVSKNLSLTGLYGHFFGDFKDHAGSLTLSAVF